MADYAFPHRHLLGIEGLNRLDIEHLLNLGDKYVELNRRRVKHAGKLNGQTLVNLFFENSTRTQGSFEIAGRRLGADVVTMPIATSSVKKGETLVDTAMTLNAMRPDLLVIRHQSSGAVKLLSRKVD
jgi:aspartate carbamoyltransferase catalytic subunit